MNTTPVNNLRGIAFLVSSGLFLTANDGITKWLVPHYPSGQILCIMASMIVVLALIIMRFRGEVPTPRFFWNWDYLCIRCLYSLAGRDCGAEC